MNPSSAAIAWIAAQSPDWARDDATIAAALNAATTPNPVSAAPRVPKSVYPSTILPMLSAASLGKVDASNFAGALLADMNAGNNAGVARWAAFYAGIGSITGPEAQSLAAQAQGTDPDPAWTATVPAPLAALGRLLDASDIAAARAAGGR